MMKSTKKKLKSKHFRYLSKEYVKDPMEYLDYFFRTETDLHAWLKDVDLMVNTGTLPEISVSEFFEGGYYCRKLIEQIEVAYIFYKNCGLPKHPNPLSFFATRKDYYNYVTRGIYTHHEEIDPADALSRFFTFKSLNEWYATLDDLWTYMTTKKSSHYDKFGDKIVAIKELLFRMIHALNDIYEYEGIPLKVPTYILTDPELTTRDISPTIEPEEIAHELILQQ